MSEGFDWHDIVESAYNQISPRDNADVTVQSITDATEQKCTALVNPAGGAGWVDSRETVEVNETLVTIKHVEETGLGEQRVEVTVV
jgi:hypothetical protein